MQQDIENLVFTLSPVDVFDVPGSMVGSDVMVGPPKPCPYQMKAKPEDESVLSWLERRQVMTIQRTESGFELWEECDRYYSAPLTRAELLQLAGEIKALAEGA